jgi:hypothetical protein
MTLTPLIIALCVNAGPTYNEACRTALEQGAAQSGLAGKFSKFSKKAEKDVIRYIDPSKEVEISAAILAYGIRLGTGQTATVALPNFGLKNSSVSLTAGRDEAPEETINSKEFADLIKNNKSNSKIINEQRSKLIGKTNEELQVTDRRIYDKFMAGKGTILELFKQEYGKELSKFGKSITTGKLLIAFLLVNLAAVINGFFFTLFLMATGGNFYAASAGTAIIIAPLSEEILRMINGNITNDHSFSDMINILEVIQYVGATMARGGLVAGIIVLLIRFFVSMNIHKTASYNLLKDRITSLIGDDSAERLRDTNASAQVTTYNIVKHAIFNMLATINTLFAIIFGSVSHTLDYFFDVKTDVVPA